MKHGEERAVGYNCASFLVGLAERGMLHEDEINHREDADARKRVSQGACSCISTLPLAQHLPHRSAGT